MSIKPLEPAEVLRSCRLCLAADQDVELFSEYQQTVRYADVARELLQFEVIDNPSYLSKQIRTPAFSIS